MSEPATIRLFCTFNVELASGEEVQEYVTRLCLGLGYAADNLQVERYWKIPEHFQARVELLLGAGRKPDQLIGEAQAIARRIAAGTWQTTGPDLEDEFCYELLLNAMDEPGPLKWAQLQVRRP